MEPSDADDLPRRMAAILNRHRYAVLTEAILATIADSDLEAALLDYVSQQLGPEQRDLTSLPEGLQMVYATRVLESEVSSGGFHEYFWNPAGQLAVEALDGFRMIGAQKHAEVLERAIAVYIHEEPQIRHYAAQGTAEAFGESAAQSQLGTLDWQFWSLALVEDTHRLRIRYI